jgi:hypothetical protein
MRKHNIEQCLHFRSQLCVYTYLACLNDEGRFSSEGKNCANGVRETGDQFKGNTALRVSRFSGCEICRYLRRDMGPRDRPLASTERLEGMLRMVVTAVYNLCGY